MDNTDRMVEAIGLNTQAIEMQTQAILEQNVKIKRLTRAIEGSQSISGHEAELILKQFADEVITRDGKRYKEVK